MDAMRKEKEPGKYGSDQRDQNQKKLRLGVNIGYGEAVSWRIASERVEKVRPGQGPGIRGRPGGE